MAVTDGIKDLKDAYETFMKNSGIYYDIATDSYIDKASGRRWDSQTLKQPAGAFPLVHTTPSVFSRPPFDPPTDFNDDNERLKMICMRMRFAARTLIPFQHLSTAKCGDKVFIFVVQNDQPVVLEDETSMFPSDQLITQLRLIQ